MYKYLGPEDTYLDVELLETPYPTNYCREEIDRRCGIEPYLCQNMAIIVETSQHIVKLLS